MNYSSTPRRKPTLRNFRESTVWTYERLAPPLCVPGARVHYHPRIGGPSDGREYEVTQKPQQMNDRPCTWLRGKTGCVALDALSLIPAREVGT